LHDIPQGAFICVYVGNLYSSEEANKQGQNFGDEYFAELDMIEVVERRKDGYESDVSDEGFEEDAVKPVSESKKILDLGLR
jgi:histone-lysine N-methyltransferase SETDB1